MQYQKIKIKRNVFKFIILNHFYNMINIKSWCYYDVIMNIFLFTSLRPCIFFANMQTRTNCELCRKNRILTNQNCPWMDLETVSRTLHTLYPWKKFFIIGSAHKVFFSSLKTWFYLGHLEFAQTCKLVQGLFGNYWDIYYHFLKKNRKAHDNFTSK